MPCDCWCIKTVSKITGSYYTTFGQYTEDMKAIYKKVLIAAASGLFIICAKAQGKITVAVAANMQYAIEAIKTEFNKTDHTEVEIVLGASGKLTQQVLSGAPFSVFISADTAFPAKLVAAKLALGEAKVYAQGLLVLWSNNPAVKPSANLSILTGANIKHIAVANAATAPYGAAAAFILKKYGLYDKLLQKLVTGESIAQVSQFIATQAAEIGFTAKAIVLSGEMQGKGMWVELNRNDYPPIKQAAVLLKYSGQHDGVAAKKFYDFLFSAKAKAIYKKFGYVVP